MRPDVNFYRKAHAVIKSGIRVCILVLLAFTCVTACNKDQDCNKWVDENTYIACKDGETSTYHTTTTSYRTTTTTSPTTTRSTATTSVRTTQETVTALPPTTVTVLPPPVTVTPPPTTTVQRQVYGISSSANIIRCGSPVTPDNPFTHGNLVVSLDSNSNILHFNQAPEVGVIDQFAVRTFEMAEEYPQGYELPLDQALVGTSQGQSLDFYIDVDNLDYVLLCT